MCTLYKWSVTVCSYSPWCEQQGSLVSLMLSRHIWRIIWRIKTVCSKSGRLCAHTRQNPAPSQLPRVKITSRRTAVQMPCPVSKTQVPLPPCLYWNSSIFYVSVSEGFVSTWKLWKFSVWTHYSHYYLYYKWHWVVHKYTNWNVICVSSHNLIYFSSF